MGWGLWYLQDNNTINQVVLWNAPQLLLYAGLTGGYEVVVMVMDKISGISK